MSSQLEKVQELIELRNQARLGGGQKESISHRWRSVLIWSTA